MKSNEDISDVAVKILESGSPLVLSSIVSLEGSSPRHVGTKMIVSSDNKSYGTIGGSLLEAAVIHESTRVLSQSSSKFMNYDLDGNSITSKGMICGGKVTILLDYIEPTRNNIELFHRWHADCQYRGTINRRTSETVKRNLY